MKHRGLSPIAAAKYVELKCSLNTFMAATDIPPEQWVEMAEEVIDRLQSQVDAVREERGIEK